MLTHAAAALFLAVSTAAPSSGRHPAEGGEELAIVSQEQLDEGFNPWQADNRPASTLRHDTQAPMPVDQAWMAVKFKAKDRGGKTIPTRVGDSVLGWRHFSSRHNITNSNVVKTIIENTSKPGGERGRPHQLVYDGALVKRDGLGFPKKLADIRIVAQHNWKTDDGRYRLPNKKATIGVITAFCQKVPRTVCPDKVNKA